jgi:hypothetical protein
MIHPLVTQWRFARCEFKRYLTGELSMDSMICLSWIVGYMAGQEHRLWVETGSGISIAPGLHTLVGDGLAPTSLFGHYRAPTSSRVNLHPG